MIVSNYLYLVLCPQNTSNLTTKISSRSYIIIIIYLLYVLRHTQSNLVVF